MQPLKRLLVFLIAVPGLAVTIQAQDIELPPQAQIAAPPVDAATPQPQLSVQSTGVDTARGTELFHLQVDVPERFNGYEMHRQSPDFGAPGSAAQGYHHFTGPIDRFTTWYRPRAASRTQWQRCQPTPFHPRGFGNLFSRPCDGYRMDYQPYSLTGSNSVYGPAYLSRMPDPRCVHCEHTDCDCR